MAIEYPESSIISRQMRDVLPSKKIDRTVIRDPDASVFRWGMVNLHLLDISGQSIRAIRQFGDYIFIDLDEHALVFGDMIGRILYHQPKEKRLPKSAVIFELDDGAAFSYNPSLYGFCKAFPLSEPGQFTHHPRPGWIQPLDPAFNPAYLAKVFSEPERKIAKQMNVFDVEYKVAGVGNGYWQEILYLAGIHPQRKSNTLVPEEFEELHKYTQKVITEALDQSGSSEEKDFFGNNGRYVHQISGKQKGQPCRFCGTLIEGKNILGANVYYCPTCQK